MTSKRKSIPKEDAHDIFLKAMRKAGVALGEGNTPEQAWYRKLAAQISKAGLYQPQEGENYGLYLKDRFNDIRRLLNQPYKTDFGYYHEKFQPLIDFVEQEIVLQEGRKFPMKICYTPKPYWLLNFWRMPPIGDLYLFKETLIYESVSKSFSIQHITKAIQYRMSRDPHPYWVALEWQQGAEKHTGYFAVYQAEGSLSAPDELLRTFEQYMVTEG